jgi:hypothetical protein
MSDYLGNLVVRSLDPTPAVRPRLASRFEPVSPALPPELVAEAPALVAETVQERAEPARPRQSRKRAVPAEEPEPVQAAAPRRAARRGVPLVETSPPGPLSHLPTDPPRERGNASESSSLVQATLPQQRPPSPVRERGPRGEVSPADRPNREDWRSPVNAEIAAPGRFQNQPHRESASRQDPPISSPVAPRQPAPRERDPLERTPVKAKLPVPLLQPRITVVERLPSPMRQEAPAAEPVIQVTIGRIEVRATPPPVQPSRPRPATQTAMSLEEYLRRRSRKGDG